MVSGKQFSREHAERIEHLQRYIRSHTGEALERRVLASIAGFSVPHLQRVFSAHVGESLAGYVRRVRLERAAWKLRMGAVNITEIALAAGYDSHAAFGKAFKGEFGVSPSEFRRLSFTVTTQMLRRLNDHEDQACQCSDR